MPYLIPILYVIVSYTFFLLPGLFDQVVELQIISALLPFLMGVVNLIVVLTVGRKWSRKTLLNCTLIIKYGLIPFYLIGGCITISVTLAALFPLPLMVLFGLVTVVFLIFGYGILLGAAPYAIAYLIKSCKEGRHSKAVVILSGICQFLFSFDVFFSNIPIVPILSSSFFQFLYPSPIFSITAFFCSSVIFSNVKIAYFSSLSIGL